MIADDHDIWEDVVKTVKPLKGKSKKVLLAKPITKKKIVSAPPKVDGVPVKKQAPIPAPPRTARKLKQEKIPVEAKLDLHGMTLAKAHKAIASFIASAKQKNMRCVEIITGRGNPERGTGQLRRHVPLWLHEEPALASLILHVEESHYARGGSFLVMLRRHKTRS
jgi:DNA-nicking Smr family endonuclease